EFSRPSREALGLRLGHVILTRFDNASQRNRSSKLPWPARAGKVRKLSARIFFAPSSITHPLGRARQSSRAWRAVSVAEIDFHPLTRKGLDGSVAGRIGHPIKLTYKHIPFSKDQGSSGSLSVGCVDPTGKASSSTGAGAAQGGETEPSAKTPPRC